MQLSNLLSEYDSTRNSISGIECAPWELLELLRFVLVKREDDRLVEVLIRLAEANAEEWEHLPRQHVLARCRHHDFVRRVSVQRLESKAPSARPWLRITPT